jgi:hypothetical protein
MKNTLLFAFLFLSAITASAQVTVKPGIRAGANFSKITNTDLDGKTDFYVGGFAAIKLTKFYTLQPEINYSRQGGKGDVYTYNYDVQDYRNEHVDLTLQYISLAVINKFTLTDNFNIHVGPTLDILTDSPIYSDSDVDLGLTAGIGYTLPFGLSIEARVKKGIVDVVDGYYYSNSGNNGNDYYSYNGNSATNLVFSVGLSYSFNVTGSSK